MSGPWRPRPPGSSGRGQGDHVRIVDTPTTRVHHPGDLVALILSALGIAVVCILAVYAQGTTTGVTEDVQGFASMVRRLVFLPVAVLEGVITLVVPVAVLIELFMRRLLRHVAETVLAAVLGLVASQVATWLITHFGILALQASFSVFRGGEGTVTLPAQLVAATALLTVAGPRSRRRTVAWSWNAVWLGLGRGAGHRAADPARRADHRAARTAGRRRHALRVRRAVRAGLRAGPGGRRPAGRLRPGHPDPGALGDRRPPRGRRRPGGGPGQRGDRPPLRPAGLRDGRPRRHPPRRARAGRGPSGGRRPAALVALAPAPRHRRARSRLVAAGRRARGAAQLRRVLGGRAHPAPAVHGRGRRLDAAGLRARPGRGAVA